MVAVHRARLHKFVETMTRAGNLQNRGGGAGSRCGERSEDAHRQHGPDYEGCMAAIPRLRNAGRSGKARPFKRLAGELFRWPFRLVLVRSGNVGADPWPVWPVRQLAAPVATSFFKASAPLTRRGHCACFDLGDCADCLARLQGRFRAAFSPVDWRGWCCLGVGSADEVLSTGPGPVALAASKALAEMRGGSGREARTWRRCSIEPPHPRAASRQGCRLEQSQRVAAASERQLNIVRRLTAAVRFTFFAVYVFINSMRSQFCPRRPCLDGMKAFRSAVSARPRPRQVWR